MQNEMSIDDIRREIDSIDDSILELINKRAIYSLKIRSIKNSSGISVYSPDREQHIIDRLSSKNSGPLFDDNVRDIFLHILKIMKDLPNE